MSTQRGNKNSDAIRILQRDRDASARATHLKAEIGMVPNSTIERKIMSTKTSIKRIALVAAAALTLGGFSAVSASAQAPTAAYTTMYDTTNGYQVVGGQATLTLGVDSNTVTTITSSGVGSIVSYAASNNGTGTETLTAVTGGFQYNPSAARRAVLTAADNDTLTVILTSAVVGTQTLTIQPLTSNGTPGTAITKVVTWTAAGSTAAATISAYLVDTTTGATSAAGLVDSTVPLSYDKAAATRAAAVYFKVKDSNGNAVSGATVTIVVSGPGLITTGATGTPAGPLAVGTVRAASVTTDSTGYAFVGISGDGQAGISTITATSGTATASRSVTFSGSAASYTLTSNTGAYGPSATYGTDDSTTASGIKVKALDAASGLAVTGSFWATSSNKAVATVTSGAHSLSSVSNKSAGYGFIAVTGVAAGTATITVQNTDPAGATAPTVTATVSIKVTTAGAADSVAFTTDKASYQAGEPGVLNVTLKNAAGDPVADGTYTIFDSAYPLISNLYLQQRTGGDNTAWSSGLTAVTTVGGVASFDFFNPSVNGSLTFTATTISASTVSSALTQNARAKAVTVTTPVGTASVDQSALAYDAASAATDAANNAYEEAQNATQAASDALAAVKALAVQVKALIALVNKIKAKLKA